MLQPLYIDAHRDKVLNNQKFFQIPPDLKKNNEKGLNINVSRGCNIIYKHCAK